MAAILAPVAVESVQPRWTRRKPQVAACAARLPLSSFRYAISRLLRFAQAMNRPPSPTGQTYHMSQRHLSKRKTHVEDGVASVERHGVLHLFLALGAIRVTRVGHPSVRLHEHGGAEVLVLVPPVLYCQPLRFLFRLRTPSISRIALAAYSLPMRSAHRPKIRLVHNDSPRKNARRSIYRQCR